MEISHTAYLCIPASAMGYGLSVLYRFHELRAGNPDFGSSEKSQKHQDKQGKNTVVSACRSDNDTGDYLEDHGDHSADRRCHDSVVAERKSRPGGAHAVGSSCDCVWRGTAAVGKYI